MVNYYLLEVVNYDVKIVKFIHFYLGIMKIVYYIVGTWKLRKCQIYFFKIKPFT